MNENTFAFPEVCLEKDYMIATYFVESATQDVVKYAAAVADEQTTGTWIEVPGETNDIKLKFGGKVVGIFEVPDYEFEVPKDVEERKFIIQIAYPMSNFNPQIPMLLTTVIGNIANAGKLKLLDLNFPRKFVEGFKGPKFGIEGLRQLLDIPERPFVNNMIKPCTGWSPAEGAAMSYEVARGGVDIIKDDELIAADLAFCPLVDRVKAIMPVLKKAYEETGEKTLYTVNITDNVWQMKEHAKRAIDAGANALMINFYTVGFSAAQAITSDPEINVPVLAHVDFSGAMFGSPWHGMSSALLMGKTGPYGRRRHGDHYQPLWKIPGRAEQIPDAGEQRPHGSVWHEEDDADDIWRKHAGKRTEDHEGTGQRLYHSCRRSNPRSSDGCICRCGFHAPGH